MNVYIPSYAVGLNNITLIAAKGEDGNTIGFINVYSNMKAMSYLFLNNTLIVNFKEGYTAYFYNCNGGRLALLRLPWANGIGIVVIDWFVDEGVFKHGVFRVESEDT